MIVALKEAVKIYATEPKKTFKQLLTNKSKEELIESLTELITAYINDKNSSTLREFVTVTIAGYEHNEKKLGYNGYKKNTEIGGEPIACEAKPKNIITNDYNLRKTKPKLNGEGGFNDYTFDRLQKHKATNFYVLSSGFVDGQLMYIMEFPFIAVYDKLLNQVPVIRQIGTYKRSATFIFGDYKNHKNLQILYKNCDAIREKKMYFSRDLYNYLINSCDADKK